MSSRGLYEIVPFVEEDKLCSLDLGSYFISRSMVHIKLTINSKRISKNNS